jgi:hypothetical protein
MFFFNKFHKILHKNEVWFMVFNASFNNISVIWWRPVLLVEETRENHRPHNNKLLLYFYYVVNVYLCLEKNIFFFLISDCI